MQVELPIVVTPGDPLGIGPEVVGRVLSLPTPAPVVVIGAADPVRRWSSRPLVALDRVEDGRELPDGAIGVVDPGDEDRDPVEVRSIRLGVDACLRGAARALVTGAIHKAKLAARGFAHPGHTEFVAMLCGVERPVMAFVGGPVRVSLATVHLPVRDVAARLSTELVLHTIRASAAALAGPLGLGPPNARIAVCGLNPHAGDGGLLGHEDGDIVAPAVRAAVAEGIDAYGPISAEAAFRAVVRGEAAWVVAMYHDQGLAPLKALEWAAPDTARSVNWTLGLPIVRVGVDHGTAYDIAGKGIADLGSARAALAFAATTRPRR